MALHTLSSESSVQEAARMSCYFRSALLFDNPSQMGQNTSYIKTLMDKWIHSHKWKMMFNICLGNLIYILAKPK